MARSEVRIGQIWVRETENLHSRVRVIDANRVSVTYQVIEMNGKSIEHSLPITSTKEFFLEQFTRELK